MTTRTKRLVDKEQYFTSPPLAKTCVDAVKYFFPLGDFDAIIEPSAGEGTFLNLLPELTRVGIDIDPPANMKHELVKSDFFKWSLSPNGDQKVLTVGNPPFGARGSLAIKFIEHAASFSDVIAFILPRGFNKYTFQNRIPSYFHLIHSFNCDDFYLPNGDPVSVKTVFQIWEKRDTKREKIVFQTEHTDFEMKHAHISRVSPEELELLKAAYPFTIPQVGANFIPRPSEGLTQGSHWFIKPLVPGVEEIFTQADYSFLADMNTAHTSLSKGDIIKAYSAAREIHSLGSDLITVLP